MENENYSYFRDREKEVTIQRCIDGIPQIKKQLKRLSDFIRKNEDNLMAYHEDEDEDDYGDFYFDDLIDTDISDNLLHLDFLLTFLFSSLNEVQERLIKI